MTTNTQSMTRYFQWAINLTVLFMFITWVVWPFVHNFLPYEDETIPDQVFVLNTEIDSLLLEMDPTFQEMYEQRSVGGEYQFSYIKTPRIPVSNEENYKESVESIVYITTEDIDGQIYIGSGSILTTDGVILTNYHVVEGATKVVVTTSDGVHYPVTGVIASDELPDITFLKIDGNDLDPIYIGDSSTVKIGEDTLVIGHAEGFINTLSIGNVAGIRSYESVGAGTNIQITNPVSAGNSGGAVINKYGEMIGVPTWSVEYEENVVQVQNLNFAVPINEALEVLRQGV